jgi:hypothetical protein
VAAIGFLSEHKVGRETIFLNSALTDLLKRD